MKNLVNKIQILNENRGEMSIYKYVSNECESDPNFFRWLFDEDFDNDFNSSLSEIQQSEFDAWLLEIKKEYLLKNWIVVKFPYADDNDAIRVTRRSNFEETNLCDTYGNYGSKVDCFDAGCYSLDNGSSSFKSDLELFIEEKFNLEGEFSYDDYKEQQEDGIDTDQPLFIEIDKAVKNWIKENENHTEVTAWSFHDSNNFKTVVLKTDFGEPDCEELDDEVQIDVLLQMPEPAPWIEGTDTTEESENYLFHFDRWATNPWFCYVERK